MTSKIFYATELSQISSYKADQNGSLIPYPDVDKCVTYTDLSEPGSIAATNEHLFTVDNFSKQLFAYQIQTDATLKSIDGNPTLSGTVIACSKKFGDFVYAQQTMDGKGVICSYTPKDGKLATQRSTDEQYDISPVAMQVDDSGEYLYVVNQGKDNAFSLFSWKLSADGSISYIDQAPLPTVAGVSEYVFSGLTTLDNQIYVLTADSELGSVYAWLINATNGKLTTTSDSPHKFVLYYDYNNPVYPTAAMSKFLYVCVDMGSPLNNFVAIYDTTASDWRDSSGGWASSTGCLHIDRDQKLLYVFFATSASAFEINDADGSLSNSGYISALANGVSGGVVCVELDE